MTDFLIFVTYIVLPFVIIRIFTWIDNKIEK